jgi:hypothetical protein
MLLTCTLFLFGCTTAINPLYDKRHPQRTQSFSERREIRDNHFIEEGGLSKKHKHNPFVSSEGQIDGFYSADKATQSIPQTKGVYNNPLAEPEHIKAHREEKNKPKVKGSDSSITKFFKNLATPLADENVNANNVVKPESAPASSEVNTFEDTSERRSPTRNKLALSDDANFSLDYQLYENMNQGGSDSTGYSYYDLADEIETVEVPLQVEESMTLSAPTATVTETVADEPSPIAIFEIEDKSDFDTYYVQENRSKLSFFGKLEKYFNNFIFALNPVRIESAHAQISEEELNRRLGLNEHSQDIDEYSDDTREVVTDQDLQRSRINTPHLKDAPKTPDKIKIRTEYSKGINELKGHKQ